MAPGNSRKVLFAGRRKGGTSVAGFSGVRRSRGFWSFFLAIVLTGFLAASDFSGGKRLMKTELKVKTVLSTDKGTALFSPFVSSEAPLIYDSGPALYFPQSALAGSFWSVRFSPLQSCSLISLSAVSAGGSGPARVHILSDKIGRAHV